ncbi:hypothetical protein QBC33DRAFT_550474 [Phialemonium atrogriseum]|uniref:Uncharacterized protein n=1 Tax=Phialemonium atrogriseum TaxID=1093897 RepID=A0AAJ0BW10_9PEZI|nr:uncharacterized protein QBC33DRAFT_550474 [Phialemonium atrogriseum]KAK1763131.1 hypothetical protein QBC33DRAFT_550474 [Phialemonium atrogriseum]
MESGLVSLPSYLLSILHAGVGVPDGLLLTNCCRVSGFHVHGFYLSSTRFFLICPIHGWDGIGAHTGEIRAWLAIIAADSLVYCMVFFLSAFTH